MTFQDPNQRTSDPDILDPQDRASLQPKSWRDRAPGPQIKRDRNMDWQPDLVNDATEWLQRAATGDEAAVTELIASVVPALIAEVKRRRDA